MSGRGRTLPQTRCEWVRLTHQLNLGPWDCKGPRNDTNMYGGWRDSDRGVGSETDETREVGVGSSGWLGPGGTTEHISAVSTGTNPSRSIFELVPGNLGARGETLVRTTPREGCSSEWAPWSIDGQSTLVEGSHLTP